MVGKKLYDSKKGIEMSFNWIFALIAGSAILVLGIFFAMQVVNSGQEKIGTETTVSFINNLESFETGIGSSKASEIQFIKENQLYLECFSNDNKPFGKQTIEYSEIGLNKKFSAKSTAVAVKNKYLFSEDMIQGKNLIVFSMPLYIPYKVSDLTIMYYKKYCFYDTPEDISDEISRMGLSNINISEADYKCKGTKVCFGSDKGCEINVVGRGQGDKQYDLGVVYKDGASLYYYDNLMYAAIFSSKNNYECNVKRLMNKFNELGKLYLDKIKIIEMKNCKSNMDLTFTRMINASVNVQTSEDLVNFAIDSHQLELLNKGADCKLFADKDVF